MSDERKKNNIESRTASTRLLFTAYQKSNHPIQIFISAAAAGFYGDRKDEVLMEAVSNGTGFQFRLPTLL